MFANKQRPTEGSFENRKETNNTHPVRSMNESNKRDWNEDSSNHRKYLRTQSSSSHRSSSQQRQNGEKEKKTTKEPLRVVGDWSEFRSSTGKTYFYNCKTEVSQWEKPKGWPSDTPPSSSSSRAKKDVTQTPEPSVKETVLQHSKSCPSNGSSDPLSATTAESIPRLTSPVDESSRMSFSSNSSRESSVPIQQANGTEANTVEHREKSEEKDRSSTESDGQNASTNSKIEREQDIQKYYRAEFIQHLTDWSSTQFEKQCFKLFDDYYAYSAKMSNALSELKGLKSNFRVLDIKRSILTQRFLRCEQHLKERENDLLT